MLVAQAGEDADAGMDNPAEFADFPTLVGGKLDGKEEVLGFKIFEDKEANAGGSVDVFRSGQGGVL